jgi:hypothetical protein
LDEDGRIDLRYVKETSLANGQKRAFIDPAPGTRLVGSSILISTNSNFGKPLYDLEPREALPGLIVDPTAPDPVLGKNQTYHGWFRLLDSLPDPGVRVTWGSTNRQFYLGVIFTALDGAHAGWVRFTREGTNDWALAESDWQRQSGATIAVGEHPVPASEPEITFSSQYTTLPPPLSTYNRDITWGWRKWTNHHDGTHGLTVDVRGHDDWKWLMDADHGTNIVAGLRGRLPLPPPADNHSMWRTNWGGIVLYSESIDASGTTTNRSGLLADDHAYAVFGSPSYYGWVHLRIDGWQFSAARSAMATGGPELRFGTDGTASAQNLDLNGDGLVDFELWTDNYQNADFIRDNYYIFPFEGSGIYLPSASSYLPPDSSVVLDGHLAWSTNLVLYFNSTRNGTFSGSESGDFTTNGYMGLRFTANDGFHYAWASFTRFPFSTELADTQANPWPDEAFTVGAPAPAPLRISATGQSTATVRWPVSLPVSLERFAITGDRLWTQVLPSRPGEFDVPPETGAALFRLLFAP